MPKYKKLPPPEFIEIHGIFSLKPGWYKTGKVKDKPGPEDTVLLVNAASARWYKGGQLHREGGPAVEKADGSLEWYRNGQRHRGDGPAIERCDGDLIWYKNNEPHREDGPAYESPDGNRQWYLDGQRLDISTLEELQAILAERK